MVCKEESELEYVELKARLLKPIVDFVQVFCDFVGEDAPVTTSTSPPTIPTQRAR